MNSPRGGADEDYRAKLRTIAEQQGAETLWSQLKEVDPESAQRIHPNDVRRTIRALEVLYLTGSTMSENLRNQSLERPYNSLIIGLNRDRAQLYERINRRVDLMIAQGLVEEVRDLLTQGYDDSLTSMQGLGYKEIHIYLKGEASLEETVDQLKQSTRRFAKRQLSWFRRMKEIEWYDMTEPAEYSRILSTIIQRVEGKFPSIGEYKSENVNIRRTKK